MYVYKKKYLGGLFYIKFDLESYKVIYRFLGIKFMERTFFVGYSKFQLFDFIKFTTSRKSTAKFLFPILLEYLKEKNGTSNLDIIPMFNRIGETYLQMFHIQEYITANKLQNPVFVSCYKHLAQISKMFYPNIPFIVVPNVFIEIHFSQHLPSVSKNLKYYQILPHNYFVNLERRLQKGEQIDFYKEIQKTMQIKRHEICSYSYLQKDIISAETKMKMLGLKKPFAFISPEAQSNDTMDKEFWNNLLIKLNNLGIDMFYNAIPHREPASYYKHCRLTLPEAKYIAEQADYIICIRSGLIDLIANNTSKIFCIYKEFLARGKELPPLSADKVINCFSLKYLPSVNESNLHEYNAEITDGDEIVEDIIRNLK